MISYDRSISYIPNDLSPDEDTQEESDSDDCVIVDTVCVQPPSHTPEVILLESVDDVNQRESTSTNSLPQLEPGPSYTVQAVDESLVAAPSARSHLNVSIDNLPGLGLSLAMPSRRSGFRYSSHTDSSSNNGSPERKSSSRGKKTSKKKPKSYSRVKTIC